MLARFSWYLKYLFTLKWLGDLREILRFRHEGPYDVIFYLMLPNNRQHLWSTLQSVDPALRVALVHNARNIKQPGLVERGHYYCSSFAFPRLHAPVLITCASGQRKRQFSRHVRHFVHLPHSPVSFHMVYHPGEFDQYDVICCSGEHHLEELREMYGATDRRYLQARGTGYGRLDYLYDEFERHAQDSERSRGDEQLQILIAPSWFAGNVLESIGTQLIERLIASGYRVVFRPHPIYRRLKAEQLAVLERRLDDIPGFSLEEPTESNRSLFESDIMISDYSGVAYEFAFLRKKPVLFLDVQRKVQNPDWEKFASVPMELGLREQVGVVTPPDLEAIVAGIATLGQNTEQFREQIEALIPRYAFNFPRAGAATANVLLELSASVPRPRAS